MFSIPKKPEKEKKDPMASLLTERRIIDIIYSYNGKEWRIAERRDIK